MEKQKKYRQKPTRGIQRRRLFAICTNYNSWFSDPLYLASDGKPVSDTKNARKFTRKAVDQYCKNHGMPSHAITEL